MVFQVYQNMKHKTIARMSNQNSSGASRLLRILELLIQFCVIAVAASIVGTAGHVLATHKKGLGSDNPVWLPLWPSYFNATSAKVLIGTGSAILFLSLVHVAVSFIPRFNAKHQPKLSALTLTAVSTLSILLAVISLVVASMLESHSTDTITLKSWTCNFSNASVGSQVPKFMSSDDFDTLCTESKFSLYAMIPILVAEVVLLAIGVWRFFKSKPSQTNGSPMLGDKSSVY